MDSKKVLLTSLLACTALLGLSSTGLAQKHQVVHARDGSGIFGYKDTPMQPWSGYHVHDPDRPAPLRVAPGPACAAGDIGGVPADATVLFAGKDLSQWRPSEWQVIDGCLVATEGELVSKQDFGDCQVHLEWLVPVEATDNVMNRGNNGLFLLGAIEVQIFDSYNTKLYPDGQAASIYAQTPPLVNACRKPGQWQTYDIVFFAPRFDAAGKLAEPAYLTMLHNGLLVHHNQKIYGHTPHCRLASYRSIKPRGPIALGAHHCPVRFRNIWVRPLRGRSK